MSNIVKVYADACVKIPNANQKGRKGRGKAACGVLIIDLNGREYKYSKYLGECTVPEAEFKGLLLALDKVVEHTRGNIEVWMDSELVIKWMNKEYRLKKAHIKPLYDEAIKLQQRYAGVKYYHFSRNHPIAKKVDKIAEDEFNRNQS